LATRHDPSVALPLQQRERHRRAAVSRRLSVVDRSRVHCCRLPVFSFQPSAGNQRAEFQQTTKLKPAAASALLASSFERWQNCKGLRGGVCRRQRSKRKNTFSRRADGRQGTCCFRSE